MQYPDTLTPEDRDLHFSILRDPDTTPDARLAARNEIATRSMRIVEAAVSRYRHRQVDLDDLRQAGFIALTEAIDAVEAPAAFYSYATVTVRFAISHHVTTQQAAGVTGAATDRLRLATKIDIALSELEAVGLTRQQAMHAVALGLGKSVADTALIHRAIAAPASLDAQPGTPTGAAAPPADQQLLDEATVEVERQAVHAAIATLPTLEAAVVRRRLGICGSDTSAAAISKAIGVTSKEVGVLERRGMARLKHPSRAWAIATQIGS